MSVRTQNISTETISKMQNLLGDVVAIDEKSDFVAHQSIYTYDLLFFVCCFCSFFFHVFSLAVHECVEYACGCVRARDKINRTKYIKHTILIHS